MNFNIHSHMWLVAVIVESTILCNWVSLFFDKEKPPQGNPEAFSMCVAQESNLFSWQIHCQLSSKYEFMMNLSIKNKNLYQTYPLLCTNGYWIYFGQTFYGNQYSLRIVLFYSSVCFYYFYCCCATVPTN